jgi:hypothetical protein
MQSEPLELVGSLQEQLTSAALLAAERFMEVSGMAHQGYDAGQINDLLIEDLEKGVARSAVNEALQIFVDHFPKDVPDMTGDAMRGTFVNALKKCNELGLG